MLIARMIADPQQVETQLDAATKALAQAGVGVSAAGRTGAFDDVVEIGMESADRALLSATLDQALAPSAMLIAQWPIALPTLFVSDMDSTMIGQECIDELADFAGLKEQVSDITERAMKGELDFESALRERVRLLAGLNEGAITQCLQTRITPMPGAVTLVQTLRNLGCRTVLVTGGFHHFADPIAEQLGFERVVGNRLAVEDGVLTGELAGPITDSSVKQAVLEEETARLAPPVHSLATGDGANDIPMLQAADYGIAYHAKPKARAAANGFVDQGDLTLVLKLLGIDRADWAPL